jgi:Zn-dependent protease
LLFGGGDITAYLLTLLWIIPGLAVAIPVHAMSHTLAAQALGDPGPRNRGFLSLREPRLYFTLYGTLMFVFWKTGWSQHPPVNEYRLRSPGAKVAYAVSGPAGNLVVAAVFALILRFAFTGALFTTAGLAVSVFLANLVFILFFANLSAFAFNLLPIPGLDGWRVLEALFLRARPRFFYDVAIRQQTIVGYLLIALFVSQFIPILSAAFGWLMAPFYEPFSILLLGRCVGFAALVPCLPSAGF